MNNPGQSRKFDGILVDRGSWPILYSDGQTVVVPLESVTVALEIKSALNAAELDDIFEKSRSLRGLVTAPEGSQPVKSRTAAFAYTCGNPNLYFFDFATRVWQFGFHSPNAICVLESAVFALTREGDGQGLITQAWSEESVPVFVRCRQDALMLFFYLLVDWVVDDPGQISAVAAYLQPALKGVDLFFFDRDFLDTVTETPETLHRARANFLRRAHEPIADLYARARIAAGLQ